MEIRRILGKNGRTTIPFPMRAIMNLRDNDVLTFEFSDDKKAVLITKTKLCDGCAGTCDDISEEEVIEFVDQLPIELQVAIFTNLLKKAEPKSGNIRRVMF